MYFFPILKPVDVSRYLVGTRTNEDVQTPYDVGEAIFNQLVKIDTMETQFYKEHFWDPVTGESHHYALRAAARRLFNKKQLFLIAPPMFYCSCQLNCLQKPIAFSILSSGLIRITDTNPDLIIVFHDTGVIDLAISKDCFVTKRKDTMIVVIVLYSITSHSIQNIHGFMRLFYSHWLELTQLQFFQTS